MKIFVKALFFLLIFTLGFSNDEPLQNENAIKCEQNKDKESLPVEKEIPVKKELPEEKELSIKKEIPVEKALIKAKLKGIRFVSSMEGFQKQTSFEGIIIENLYTPKGFTNFVKKFLNRDLDLTLLNEIKSEVLNFYKQSGFIFTFVAVPSQDLQKDQVSILILLGRVGDIEIQSKYHTSYLKNQMSLKKGSIITEKKIYQDSMWLNSNPFKEVFLVFKPGKKEGYTDIEMNLKEKFPLRVYGTYEHNGYFLGGNSRYLTGLNASWVFQVLDYQFTSGDTLDKYMNHSADYRLFLPWQNVLKLFGTYSKSHSNDDQIDTKGKAYEAKAHYEIPLALKSMQNVFTLGYEFKRANNFQLYRANLLSASSSSYRKNTDISQFLLGYQWSLADKLGNTSMRSFIYFSPGGMTHYNEKSYYVLERPGATPKYLYWKVFLDRTFFLPKKFLWVISSIFQVSTNKLLPTEQFSLGGFYTVRGYKENKVISDNGVNIINELRTPSFSLFKSKKDNLLFLAFFDFGRASNVDKYVLNKHAINLYSTGVGVRYNFKDNLVFRLDQGFALKHIQDSGEKNSKKMQTHLALTFSF